MLADNTHKFLSTIERTRVFAKEGKVQLVQGVNAQSRQFKTRLTHEVIDLVTAIRPRLIEVDSTYQHFVRNHIDPLLGKKRQDYVTLLAQDNKNELAVTKEERVTNYLMAVSGLALVFVGLGALISPFFTWVAITLGLSSMYESYQLAYREWKQTHKIGTIHLVCIYVIFLWGGGYALVGALGILLSKIGFKIKQITERQSRHNLVNLFQIQPDTVWIRHPNPNGVEISVPFDQLQVGDIVVLHAGQTVPVDGIIVAGSVTVDQHLLTGEAQPIEKTINDPLFATTVIFSGKVDMQVEKTGAETTAGQLVKILNNAAQYNTRQGLKVVEVTDNLVMPTLLISALSFPMLGPAGAVSLMGANTTIATYISNPLAVLNFLNLAAEHCILVKDGTGLEQLSQVDTIVFDKTGTLTLEQLYIAQIHLLSHYAEDELLRLAAAAEMRQIHPIAQAIVSEAKTRRLEIPRVDHVQYEVGYGLHVRLPQGTVKVGSQRFMHMERIFLPPQVEELTVQCHAEGHSLLMVAVDGELAGCIELQPAIRPEAKTIVAELQKQGLNLVIISGDQETPTSKLANDLGMNAYFANTLPEQKADLVQQLQHNGHGVCFVGDGINDALAMRQADVSISLRGATSAATDTAQIILMEGNLYRLSPLLDLARDFERNLNTNLKFTSAISLFAAGGIFFAGFTFAATELFYIISLLGGLGIAMKPVLDQRKAQDD